MAFALAPILLRCILISYTPVVFLKSLKAHTKLERMILSDYPLEVHYSFKDQDYDKVKFIAQISLQICLKYFTITGDNLLLLG